MKTNLIPTAEQARRMTMLRCNDEISEEWIRKIRTKIDDSTSRSLNFFIVWGLPHSVEYLLQNSGYKIDKVNDYKTIVSWFV